MFVNDYFLLSNKNVYDLLKDHSLMFEIETKRKPDKSLASRDDWKKLKQLYSASGRCYNETREILVNSDGQFALHHHAIDSSD